MIISAAVITFQFSENDYQTIEEANALVGVQIAKNLDVLLANQVLFRVTPLTVDDALARGVIADFPFPDNDYSPIKAGKVVFRVLYLILTPLYGIDANDFNTTVFEVTFPVDEGSSFIVDIPADISIADDEVDEAEMQYFIAYLEILDAVNFDLINIAREVTYCSIIDNDGECSNYI